jgi:hypothetical protein
VDVDAVVAVFAASPDGHVDPRSVGGPDLMQVRGVAVRENGAGTTGEYGGHVAPLSGEERGRDQRVDRLVDTVHRTGRRTLAQRRRGDPKGGRLHR